MLWANFLHIYQPPTQKEIWVRRIAEESYRKVINGIAEIPRARVTLNINGILCELLDRFGGKDILHGIKKLLQSGNIELTGSAKYHAFLPLLPESEIERQIKLNEGILDKHFGDLWRKPPHGKQGLPAGRQGFFTPEMAYSKKVASVAARLGYKWIIMDELGFPAHHKYIHDTIYKIKDLNDFSVFFRERALSFTILSSKGAGAAPTILRFLGDRLTKNEYVVTAMDGETFGHHRPGLEILLFDLLNSPEITPVTLSEVITSFEKTEAIEPQNSTWAATKKDMQAGTPYSRWQSEKNEIQKNQWLLTHLAIEAVNRGQQNLEARELLDRALHSDQYWWASARPWWSLEMIERGAYELKTVVLKSPQATAEEKAQAEELYKKIIYMGFEWQRSGLVDQISRQEDEEVIERLEAKEKFFITKAEYSQMIRVLEEQIQIAVKAQEYHRAAMIKDRIRELKEEMAKTSS
ncbi:MAG TPA: UvrB/UvrC motif-containing protein [Candidatus Paceibacterota bacterium]